MNCINISECDLDWTFADRSNRSVVTEVVSVW